MRKTAIILTGGTSSRFGKDKGLLRLGDKMLIKHTLDVVSSIVDEIIVVVSSKIQAAEYKKKISSEIEILVDLEKKNSPLIGALTGFKAAHFKYVLLLPCDTPFLCERSLLLYFDLCLDKNAAIPRWPNGYIEPLQSVYCRNPALEAAERAVREGKSNLQSMVNNLRGIRYISTMALQHFNISLVTFFNVNTPADLKKAERILKSLNTLQ